MGLEAWPRCFCRSETFCDISMISEIIYVVLLVERVADSSIVTSVPLEGKTFTDFVLLDGKFFDMATGYGFGRMGGHSGRFDILATASDISEDETGFVDVRGKRRRRYRIHWIPRETLGRQTGGQGLLPRLVYSHQRIAMQPRRTNYRKHRIDHSPSPTPTPSPAPSSK